jgi:membrane fusion protein, heavy metal efflux system
VTASGAIALDAPFDAVLRAVHAGPGQTVAAAAPLFDLVRLDTVWIRVPLYAGDIDAIDRRAPARFVPLGSASDAPGSIARPVSAPPSADASTAAVDLYYAVPNTVTAAAARDTASLRPGQRLGVRVPLVSDTTSLVAPRAALLHDAYGGTWVYETTGAHVFTRRRVSVVDLVGDLAVLAVLPQGPALGTRVVTVGAAELFGTEFGAGK